MHKVYVFRNRKTGSYTLPEFRFEEPEDYDRGLTRFIIVNTVEAFNKHYDELELYHIGTYDDEICSLVLFEKPKLVNDYGPICEQMKKRLEEAHA